MALSYAVSFMLCCRAMDISLGTKMGFLFLIIVGVLGVGHLPAMADALRQRPCLPLSSLASVVGQVLSWSLKDSFLRCLYANSGEIFVISQGWNLLWLLNLKIENLWLLNLKWRSGSLVELVGQCVYDVVCDSHRCLL